MCAKMYTGVKVQVITLTDAWCRCKIATGNVTNLRQTVSQNVFSEQLHATKLSKRRLKCQKKLQMPGGV